MDLNQAYTSIDNVSDKALNRLLIMQVPQEILVEILKSSDRLVNEMGFKGFRPEKIFKSFGNDKVRDAFVKQMEKDFDMFTMFAQSWAQNASSDFAELEDKDREYWIEHMDEIIEEHSVPAVITYIRFKKEDMVDLIPPLLSEWQEEKGMKVETEQEIDEYFSEKFGVDLFNEDEEKQEPQEQENVVDDLDDFSTTEMIDYMEIIFDNLKKRIGESNYKGKYESAQQEIKELNNLIEELETESDSKEKQIKNLQHDKSELEQNLENKQETINELNHKNGELGSKVGELRKENEKLSNQLEKAENKKERLENKLENVKEETEQRLEKKFEDKAMELRMDKNDEIDSLKEDKEKLKDKVDNLKDKINAKQKKIDHKQEVLDKKEEKIEELKLEHKEEKEKLYQKINELKQQKNDNVQEASEQEKEEVDEENQEKGENYNLEELFGM